MLRDRGRAGARSGCARTFSARSMPIFMVPADEGHVPHAPCAVSNL